MLKNAAISCIAAASIFAFSARAQDSARSCHATPETGDNRVGEAYGLTGRWIGDERLAALRLTDGEPLGAISPGDSIVLKHLWWALGYRPPMERDLSVSIVELNRRDGSVHISAVTNAKIDDTWYMMVGLSFSDPGCWEVTGTYREQTVSFVVEVRPE